jgi:hypothetical protein
MKPSPRPLLFSSANSAFKSPRAADPMRVAVSRRATPAPCAQPPPPPIRAGGGFRAIAGWMPAMAPQRAGTGGGRATCSGRRTAVTGSLLPFHPFRAGPDDRHPPNPLRRLARGGPGHGRVRRFGAAPRVRGNGAQPAAAAPQHLADPHGRRGPGKGVGAGAGARGGGRDGGGGVRGGAGPSALAVRASQRRRAGGGDQRPARKTARGSAAGSCGSS